MSYEHCQYKCSPLDRVLPQEFLLGRHYISVGFEGICGNFRHYYSTSPMYVCQDFSMQGVFGCFEPGHPSYLPLTHTFICLPVSVLPIIKEKMHR